MNGDVVLLKIMEPSKETYDETASNTRAVLDIETLSKIQPTVLEEWLCSTVCLVSGMLTFFVYYQMNLSFVALKVIWPGQEFSALLGGFEYITAALVIFCILPFNGFRLLYFYISWTLYIFVAIAFPLVASKCADNFITGRALLVVVMILTGVADGLLSFAGFSMAAKVTPSRVGLYSGTAHMQAAFACSYYC